VRKTEHFLGGSKKNEKKFSTGCEEGLSPPFARGHGQAKKVFNNRGKPHFTGNVHFEQICIYQKFFVPLQPFTTFEKRPVIHDHECTYINPAQAIR
jgi:hypothetical protein